MSSPADIFTRAPVKLAAYAAVLVLMVGGGAAVGAAAGPIDVSGSDGGEAGHGGHPSGEAPAGDAPSAQAELDATGSVVDVHGYTVTLDGDVAVGESEVAFAVVAGGDEVAADGWHLVAIRAADLEPVEVRALEAGRFAVTFPEAGQYRLVLDFAAAGEAHTAAFTVDAGDPVEHGAH